MFTERRHSLNFYSKQLVLICLMYTHDSMELNLIIVNKNTIAIYHLWVKWVSIQKQINCKQFQNKAIVLIQKQI